MAATATATATPAQQDNPMAPHVKVVAILDLALGGLTALMGVAMVFAFGVGRAAVDDSERYGTPAWVADMMASMAIIMGVICLLVAVLYILAGLKLLNRQRAGRGLGIFAAVLQVVFSIPMVFAAGIGLLGLGAGIYGLVILSRADTERLLVEP